MPALKRILPKLFWLITIFLLTTVVAKAKEQFLSAVPQEIILISVHSQNEVMIGKDTFDMEGLTHELQQRFWKSYLGTGKIPIKLKVQYATTPTDIEQKTIINAIKKAQQNALTELCLQLHKKTFDELSARQQDKIKKQYPILFQQKF
ncbi:MAG TPA: hypothetical protein VG676_06910 [Chitinophagaceae bacterium]|jgi:hypothetical protein|nr:hypothetical protein [Chitinophagaceae bacterium]